MSSIFELKRAKDEQYYFNLKAGNGEVVLTSEMYKAKDSALNGIDSVRTNASLAERFEKKTSTNGKPYFVLKAANHQVIGKSEMYESDGACDNGIASVRSNAAGATLKDTTA